jgi:hypothetical protein
MPCATRTSIASPTTTPNRTSASACNDVPRWAEAAAMSSSLPVWICAWLPERRFTSASKAGRPAAPRVRWNTSPTALPTEPANLW